MYNIILTVMAMATKFLLTGIESSSSTSSVGSTTKNIRLYYTYTRMDTDDKSNNSQSHSHSEDERLYFSAPVSHSLAYLDIVVGDRPSVRVTVELYDDKVPVTSGQFRQLCTGELGKSHSGTDLHYKNTLIDMIVKGHVIGGGKLAGSDGSDVIDALSGESDEHGKQQLADGSATQHNEPFQVSVVPGEPGFVITLAPKPAFDESRVVVGRVVGGRTFIRALEVLPTDQESSSPLVDVTIVDCGIYQERRVRVRNPDESGDFYELNIRDDLLVDFAMFDTVFQAVAEIKEKGTFLFKQSKLEDAMSKYQKGLDYLQEYFPEDLEQDQIRKLVDLKVSLMLNNALIAIRLNQFSQAEEYCNEALAIPECRPQDQTKALYRRAQARLRLNNEQEAEKDLNSVLMVLPNDGAALQLLSQCHAAKKRRVDREKLAFGRAFQ